MSVEPWAKWAGGERHVIEDILRFVDTSSKTYFASRHMSGPWWLLWQRHSLPIGALLHSRACLIGLLHKLIAVHWCHMFHVLVGSCPVNRLSKGLQLKHDRKSVVGKKMSALQG